MHAGRRDLAGRDVYQGQTHPPPGDLGQLLHECGGDWLQLGQAALLPPDSMNLRGDPIVHLAGADAAQALAYGQRLKAQPLGLVELAVQEG